ncbi:glutamate--cysteine ligase [Anaplasma marginale]|nr:glutamate--cysteine ligase [Anaplasma marginale]AXW85517.1 glutamate--cysteine ligase [Anaplasma marginale]KAA8475072.1 glutamate--cysteine ligase [Anaplasma marginale]KAB0452604.1 glutamate--cysteine ligase [Anaplasma marginale]KAB0453203.1 glutamate--cysteine ligase [Anaplasma marginale]
MLEDVLERRAAAVEDWFADWFSRYPAVLSTSVDVRSSGYKIAPVDVNFFPAGYNNFGVDARQRAESAFLEHLSQYLGSKVLIVVESHTRNKKYVDSVMALKDILGASGFQLEVGACGITEDMSAVSSTGATLDVKALVNCGGEVSTTSGFVPDLIILNNDLTSGIPGVLDGILTQRMIPPLHLGWFNRRKSRYFGIYSEVAEKFCTEFGIDKWGVCTLFAHCQDVDFVSRKGIDDVASGVEDLISKIGEKFRFYGLDCTPHVFIKADNGTYGMGVIEVYSGEDVLNMNKKNRNKMRMIKENNPVESVVLQEGVPTSEVFGTHAAEPLLYCVGAEPVCYLCRYNSTRSRFESLNAPGCGFADVGSGIAEEKKRIWRTVGKLAILAAAIEAEEIGGAYVNGRDQLS